MDQNTLDLILRLKDELTPAMKNVEGSLNGIVGTAKKVTAALASAFSIRELGMMGQQALEATSNVNDMASAMGVSAEAAQRLKFAAEQSGGSFQNVGKAIKTMATHLTDPSDGVTAAIENLGLNVDALAAMKPEDAFTTIADAIAKMPDPLKQSATATDLFGNAGVALLPAMKAGFSEIGAAAPVMSNAVVAAGDDVGDKLDAMKQKLEVTKANALIPLMSAFTELPSSVQVAGLALTQFGPALGGISTAIMAAGGPVAMFTSLGTLLTGTIVPLFTVTLPAAFSAVLPFLGPGALIVGGVIAVYEAWKHWDDIVAFFKGAWQTVTNAVARIPDILLPLGGPIGAVVLAFRHWDEIVVFVRGVYLGVKEWLVDKFQAIVDGVKAKIDAVTGFFKGMYDKVVGHSYVPDMVEGVGIAFSLLDAKMVVPAQNATGNVAQAFFLLQGTVAASIENMNESVDAFNLYAEHGLGAIADRSEALRTATKQANDELMRSGMLMPNLAVQSEGVSQAVTRQATAWQTLGATMKGAFANLPNIIMSAITGGGDIVKAIGGSIFGSLFSADGPLVKGVTGKLSGALGTTIGGALGSVIPGVGTMLGSMAGQLVGPLIGKVGGFFKGLFGGETQGHKDLVAANAQIKELQAGLIATYGSLDNIRAMGGAAGIELANAWGDQNVAGLANFRLKMDEFTSAVQRSEVATKEAAQAGVVGFEDVKSSLDVLRTQAIGVGGKEGNSLLSAIDALQLQMTTAAASGVTDFSAMTDQIMAMKAKIAEEIRINISTNWMNSVRSLPAQLSGEGGGTVGSDWQVEGMGGSWEAAREQFLRNNPGDEGRFIQAMTDIGRIDEALHNTPGMASGTQGRYVDWGRESFVRLHGKERVSTPAEGQREDMAARTLERIEAAMARRDRDLPLTLINAMKAAKAFA